MPQRFDQDPDPHFWVWATWRDWWEGFIRDTWDFTYRARRVGLEPAQRLDPRQGNAAHGPLPLPVAARRAPRRRALHPRRNSRPCGRGASCPACRRRSTRTCRFAYPPDRSAPAWHPRITRVSVTRCLRVTPIGFRTRWATAFPGIKKAPAAPARRPDGSALSGDALLKQATCARRRSPRHPPGASRRAPRRRSSPQARPPRQPLPRPS